jgi:hypothetical protein
MAALHAVPNTVKIVDRPAAIIFELCKGVANRHPLPNVALGIPEVVVQRDLLNRHGTNRLVLRPRRRRREQ